MGGVTFENERADDEVGHVPNHAAQKEHAQEYGFSNIAKGDTTMAPDREGIQCARFQCVCKTQLRVATLALVLV